MFSRMHENPEISLITFERKYTFLSLNYYLINNVNSKFTDWIYRFLWTNQDTHLDQQIYAAE